MPAPEQKKINVIIVDDEEEACANLKHILHEYVDPELLISAEAHSTAEAERMIALHTPDALFLDIEMPNENAFLFLERISPVSFEVIFVTAYDDYAIRAFKLNAVDYILKPISINELSRAVIKLKDRLKYKSLLEERDRSYVGLANQVTNKLKSTKITLKDSNNFVLVDFKDIYFVEAQGSYARIVFTVENVVKEIVLSNSLSDYEELLPANQFYRIHKSYLINCVHITQIFKDDSSQVLIKGHHRLPISRRRFQPLLEFLKNNNYQNE